MATETISLNSIYSKALHRPITSDGFVLYTKADGYTGTVEGASKAEMSQIYQKASQSTYNSPTNIRRVFITGEGIGVQYYTRPIAKNGKATIYNFTKFDKNLFDVAMHIASYSADIAKYNMSKAAGMKGEEPKRYTVKGNALGVISHPYVCNNIEEIYFDWTALMSDAVSPYFPEFTNAAAYEEFMTGTEIAGVHEYGGIQHLFEVCNNGGIKSLRNRFPRLRAIAMVSKLQKVLDVTNPVENLDPEFNNIEQSKLTWFEVNRIAVEQSGSLVLYSDLSSQLQFPNKEFIIKANQYKFDYDKLESAIRAFKAKITDEARKKYDTPDATEDILEDDDPDLAFEIGELEQKCIDIEKEYGEKVIKNALLYAFKGSDIKVLQLKKMLEQFSKPNRVKYAAMIGLKMN